MFSGEKNDTFDSNGKRNSVKIKTKKQKMSEFKTYIHFQQIVRLTRIFLCGTGKKCTFTTSTNSIESQSEISTV